VLAAAKQLLRVTNAQTVGWDDPMPVNLRNRWGDTLDTHWRYEMLTGLMFSTPIMPVDAVNTKMRLLPGAHAADPVIMIGAWGDLEREMNPGLVSIYWVEMCWLMRTIPSQRRNLILSVLLLI
jgi:hypothetical protein